MTSRVACVGAFLIVAAVLGGCSNSPSGSSAAPTTVAGRPSPATSGSTTLAPSTTSTATRDPSAPVGLQIDARRVLDAAGTECTGGVLGGQGDVTWAYEIWTLHCPAEPGSDTEVRRLVDALRAEVESQGAKVDGEGEIVSNNAGNKGDRQVQLDYRFEGVETWIRVTSLQGGDRYSIVVTIDHEAERA